MYQKLPAHYIPAAVVSCLGVLLTLSLCVLWQRYYHQARVQAQFEHRAVTLADVLQSKLMGLLGALESIGDLYSASLEVERGEFESFILRAVKQHRAIQGLNWVPRVPEERRAEFEIAAQAEGLANFQFTERNPAGQFIRAGQRAEYFPIYFIAPLVGLRPVLGFDLDSDPARRAILEQARDTGQMAATPPITLVQGTGQDIGTTGETTRAMGALGTLSGVRTDGEEFPIEASISKVEIAGHLFFTVILRDMTERQQTGQVLREQAALAALETEISRAMTRSEGLADMLGHCTEALVRHLDAAFARIWTLNEADNVLELQASAGMYTHINGSHGRVPVGQFKIGLIAQERQPHFTNAVMTDPRVGDKEWASREGMVSFAGYPLMVGDRLFGVIAMFARHPLSKFVLQALATIATNIPLGLERLQAREALRESELRFRQLVEHIHEVFYLFEVESQQILYISPAYEQIWGRSTQTLYQQSTDFIEAVHPDDRPCVYAMLDQHTRGEQSIIEYRIVRPTGEVRWILDRAFPFRDHPQDGYRVAGVAEDITERKQAEEALRQMNDIVEQSVTERTAALSAANTELSKATRLKDEFLASMSHELRTPLNAILGLSEALQEQVYGSLTEKQHQSLHRIEESGRHLLALITDILDLSKIEAGKVELTVSPVDAAGVCQASLCLIRENARQKHLHVTSQVDPAVSTLLADERRLKQMLVNLLSNAVKFTPEEGCIMLEVTGHPDERVVSFTVSDTGIGIADMERLFQPFVQLDSSLARPHAGTGLGLSLVAHLADLHGGRVMLESTVGQGSRFCIVLPWRVNT